MKGCGSAVLPIAGDADALWVTASQKCLTDNDVAEKMGLTLEDFPFHRHAVFNA
jgi:hypothetical protein